MIDETDKKVISLIQGDLPPGGRPFAPLAREAGMSEEDFLARIRSLKERGVIRRFGATLRHQEAGFNSNAMIAWHVPEDKIDQAGERLARYREVTHCYHRRPQGEWKYNLYTMVHGDSPEECRRVAERMSRETGVEEYEILFSEREFKKTSMEYFQARQEGGK